MKFILCLASLALSVSAYADGAPIDASAPVNALAKPDEAVNQQADSRITQLESLFATQKLEELKPLLTTLRAEKQPHLAVLFISGMLASQEGDYKTAADEFRAMLTRDPNLIRPRLELALALQKAGDRQSAKYHYEQALAGNIPDEVRRTIYRQLGDIRERLPSVRLSLDMVSDSNPKQATNSRVITIGGLPYTLNDSSKAKTEYGLALSADVHWPLPADPTWYAHAYTEINEYAQRDLDSIYGQVTVGKRLYFGQNNLSAEVGGHVSSYQDRKQYDGLQARGTGFMRISPKLGVTSVLGYKTYNYERLPYLDGNMKSVNVTGIYIPQATQRLELGAGFSRYLAQEDAYTYNQPSLSARFMQEWQGGWLTGARIQGLVAGYAAPDPFFGITRHEKEVRVELDVLNRKLKFLAFSPKLLLGYVQRDSNLELYSYQRWYGRVGLSTEF
jgi:tetratricopeptide (TPR) repeat protein